MKSNLTETFGLKLIPFSSQASETGKYPFVPSNSFNELIGEIEKIHEQKDSSAIIVRGPQGSGKSATRKGVVDAFLGKTNIAVIAVSLSSIDLRDLTWSIIDKAKEQNLINDKFMQEIGYMEGFDIEKPKLEKIIIQVIEKILSKKEFGILIIDEFDIISQPTFHDTNDQTIFLHNITNILNSINESKIVQEKSFCTILAQTDKSSDDFRNYIASRHRPLSTRLKENIDIEYNFDETKQIILKRLESERMSGFEKAAGNDLFPLDEEIIKFLYGHINQLTQTSSMMAFRDMEQILHDSIEKSLEKNLAKVEMDVVKEIFTQNTSKLKNEITQDTRKISLETRNELAVVMNDKDHSIANNLYLQGIKTAMKTWETGLYRSVESEGAKARLIPNEKNKFYLNSIRLDVRSNTNHYKTIIWYNASKEGNEEFTDDDFISINSFLEQNRHEQNGCQFSILTIFSDHPTKNEIELQKDIISSVDKIYFRNNIFKQSIIGIEVASSDEERIQFRGEWNAHLHSVCTDKLGETLHDIDKELKEQHKILVQILYAKNIIGEKLKRENLKKLAKQLSNIVIRDQLINDIVTLGFADEELNALVPRNLKSLKNLIELNLTPDKISNHFSKPFTIDAAKLLGIIDEGYKLINVDSLKNEISKDLFEKIKSAVPENSQIFSTNEEILKLLKDSFEKIYEESNFFKKIIVLNFINEQANRSLHDLSPNPQPQESEIVEELESEVVEDTRTESSIIDSNAVLQVCQEILKGEKLTLNELKNRIAAKKGFEDQSKWVTFLFQLIHDQKILLTVD